MGKFYATTPIYYANDIPHIGSAYTTVAADVLARYHRRRGDDTFFLTGTDEHGAKVAEAAAQHGVSPKEYTDRIVAHFQEAWHLLGISNDHFIRTTDPRHEAGVQAFLAKLHERGEIYPGKYEGLYCVGCEAYVSPDELVDGLCPTHRRPPVVYSEDNYFFRLGKYQDVLIKAITDETDPNHYTVAPVARRNEVLGKIRVGLSDISISRASLAWGVPLPFDPSQTAYVWVDALLNYITAIGYADDPDTFARLWPADVHLVGKDILWFHAIIWPAMLIAAGVRPPAMVFAHGFFTVNGQKMSKSLGNVIVPGELVQRFGADASRYLLLSEFPFGLDGDISLPSFVTRYNAELANDLGNLLNRTVAMINRYFGGKVPAPGSATELDDGLKRLAADTSGEVAARLDHLEFEEAIAAVRGLVTRANKYVEETAPWTLARTDRQRLETVLYNLAEVERLIAELLWPFMPTTSEKMAEQLGTRLGLGGGWTGRALQWGQFPHGAKVTPKPTPIFPRIES